MAKSIRNSIDVFTRLLLIFCLGKIFAAKTCKISFLCTIAFVLWKH